jgi:hypothetical protein
MLHSGYCRHHPNRTLQTVVGLLLIANIANIGPDLGAMDEQKWFVAIMLPTRLCRSATAGEISLSTNRYCSLNALDPDVFETLLCRSQDMKRSRPASSRGQTAVAIGDELARVALQRRQIDDDDRQQSLYHAAQVPRKFG